MSLKPRERVYNPKRRLADEATRDRKAGFYSSVDYGGNPEHKRNPGDFDLTPPAAPRIGKTLCDDADITTYSGALRLLRKGMRAGLVSQRCGRDTEWPQNIWTVTNMGVALEAQLENPVMGIYHGYPMPEGDPMRDIVLEYWSQHHD